ncbi:MAG: helix-turn-helix domain-containing protein, partial [Oscillospiraceae bacterium]|nr:helix-turn-helix domain-containing protein [Oscillospiraceae bacterium]
TDDEKDRINFEVSIIGKLIEARESMGLTQKALAEQAGIKQSAVARLESMKATPQIDTLFKVLKPLGYTLEIVPTVK